MLNFTLYTATCVGNCANCLYPNKAVVNDKASFIDAIKMDHVTAKYKGYYRSKDNFEQSDNWNVNTLSDSFYNVCNRYSTGVI